MKIIDIDEIFQKYLTDFLKKNAGKFTEDELEGKIPALYEKFAETPLKELDGKMPDEFYRGLSAKELVELLKEHIVGGVSASDFLFDAIIADEACEDELCNLLADYQNEELFTLAINLLRDKDSKKPLIKYIGLLGVDELCEDVTDLLVEVLSDNAELVKETVIEEYAKNSSLREQYVDILSKCRCDERVYDILLDAFLTRKEKIALYADYLAQYGDDRALPSLYEAIDDDTLDYLEFKELKIAIEALGGVYDKKRDFSGDKYYEKLNH